MGAQQRPGRAWLCLARGLSAGQEPIHVICKGCGTVVRS